MPGVTTNVPVKEMVQTSPVQVTFRAGLNKLAQASKSNTNVGEIPAVWQGISTQYIAKLLAPVIVISVAPVPCTVLMHNLKLLVRAPLVTVPSNTMVANMVQGPGASAKKKCPLLSQGTLQ